MKARDFQRVSLQKQRLREDGLLLKVGTGLPGAGARLGIVVSKKVAKQAVRRNRIRRVLKEAARTEMGSAQKGQDFVLVVLPGFEVKNIQEAKETLRRLFHKTSLRH